MLRLKKGDEIRVYNLAKNLSTKNEIIILESTKYNNDSYGKSDKFVKNLYFFNDYRIKNTRFGIIFMDLNPSFLFNLFKILKTKKIDIIQISFPWGIIATKILTKLKNYRIPVIYDAHNVQSDLSKILASKSNRSRIKKLIILYYTPTLERFLVKFVNHIIAVGDNDRNRFIEKYSVNPEKITVIPSGTAIHNLKDIGNKYECKEKFNIDTDKLIIIFHGTYTFFPNKEAIDLIINYIAPTIMKQNPNVLFVIAGLDVPRIEKDNIKSIGFVEDIYSLIHAADIAIVPILRGGGTRLKILDYMGIGLPIVTTKKGIEGISAKNGEDAIIVDGVDEEFIDAIIHLINNKRERKRIGTNTRKLAEEEYNWDKIGEKLNGLYENLLEK